VKKIDIIMRITGVLVLLMLITFYDRITPLVAIPAVSLSFILMLGQRANHEPNPYSQEQRRKVISSSTKSIKWTQSPILWMIILIVFGGGLSLFIS
jgi:hypothetical protein